MATRIQPLPGKYYSLPSRGEGVVRETERMKSECPRQLENPDFKKIGAHRLQGPERTNSI